MEAVVDPAHRPGQQVVHHHDPGFWRQYVFSTDHKVIGIQYGLSALVFLLVGFGLMMLMRWSIAYPNQPVPVVGSLLETIFGSDVASKGSMSADLYNSFGAMHGTIMVFLAVVPLAFAAFGVAARLAVLASGLA